jgi:hypothetical protein
MRVRPGMSRGALLAVLIVVVVELLIAFFALKACAMPTMLLYTVPDRGQDCHRILGEEGDSVTVCDCTGTAPISQVTKAYLWGARITGGGFALADSHTWLPTDPIEGRPDSFPVPFAGHFYLEFRNPVGKSCASNIVLVMPDVTTGVEPDRTPFPPIRPTWHDVSGRLVESPRGTGIFFQRREHNGRVWSRTVFVRSSRPQTFGRWK